MFSYESQTESRTYFGPRQDPYFGALYCGDADSTTQPASELNSAGAGGGLEEGGPGTPGAKEQVQ